MNPTPPEDTPLPPTPSVSACGNDGAAGGPLRIKADAQLGDYSLIEKVLDEPTTETWKALQLSVQREVALEKLKPAHSESPGAVEEFRALVRARAAAVHQYIASVYEVQETPDGIVYYTRELVNGRNLGTLHSEGTRLAPDQVLSIFLATAEAMAYLDGQGIPHSALTAAAIHLGEDGIPRLNNIASVEPSPHSATEEVQHTARALSLLMHRGMQDSDTAHSFLQSLADGEVPDWSQAVELARRVLRSISGESRADASQPWDSEPPVKSRNRAKPAILVGTLLVCGAIVAGAYFALTGGSPAGQPIDLGMLIQIPAGTITGPGGSESVAAFSIDQHEVTIGQYAAFIEALTDGSTGRFDHPDQPPTKTHHAPSGWDSLLKAAKGRGKFQGQQISLDHPIVAVDWWDAYAYAKWKGRRLPTASEWHLAALGPDPDARFPWGKRDAPELYNSGADFDQLGDGGAVDGFNYWAPVAAFANDRSPHGVVGMAGNVSEWVDTWTHHPDFPDRRVPTVMGGSFATKAPNVVERRPAKKAEAAQLAVGFRTAASGSR